MSDEEEAEAPRGERIAKFLARAGVASRRDAEKLIAEGLVRLGGKLVTSPATFVSPGDQISVNGKPIAAPERTRLFRYHKPTGFVTTHRDPEGRPTVFANLPQGLPRLVSVGRLDLTSEGLLLLTNDGALARKLELPANGWVRRYRVRVHGKVDERALAALARGVTVEGVAYGPIEAGLDARMGTNAWLTVALREGKNREVRKVMAHLGLAVTRLIRTAYGSFQLGALPRGAAEEVNAKV
ncbi:MAG: rRNA pseudouridine synthase, partial [Roseomonas sp.]|nr:rRNA pseudouridine synthase [Roseomonas sp.]